jgi:flagellar basal-body rod modification protein FlgD
MASTIPATTSTTTTTGTTSATNAKSILGKDDFLKLFVAQLQHQNPLDPMQDMEFMGQMASFTTLEQISKLASANETLASQQVMSNAVGLIGRTVTYTGADKQPVTGTVESVSTKDGKTVLTVGGVAGIDPTKITQVA